MSLLKRTTITTQDTHIYSHRSEREREKKREL